MPLPDDRALRRAVAKLAQAHPEDVGLVLGALEPDRRIQVEALLEAYRAPVVLAVDSPAAKPEPARDLSAGCGSWLAERISQAAAGAGVIDGLTAALRDALMTAAADVPPPPPAPSVDAEGPGEDLVDPFSRWLRRRKGA